MITHPNAKINLGLQVVRRRADGYHDLQTIFVPVHSLCDTLEIKPLPESVSIPVMHQSGIALDNTPADNLCVRAWQLMHQEFGIPAVEIRLQKSIPFGAGLGGGSSDAAHTLLMLNSLFDLHIAMPRLASMATQIGADCPFFIYNRPAYATGIGDQLQPLEVPLEGYQIQVEIPDGEHVSTREAYAGLRLTSEVRTDLREAIHRPIAEWKNLIGNDFEQSVFPSHPAIAQLKEQMYAQGAVYACMTGSGAAVFGIFAQP